LITDHDIRRAREIVESLRSDLDRFPKVKDVYINEGRDSVVFLTNVGGNLVLPIGQFLSLFPEQP
jgi:hypothetical protein